jgi:urease accessory protein
MFAVGLWAAQLGGAALWRAPVAFLGAMGLGAAAADPGFAGLWLEQAIAASVLALGLLAACAWRLPSLASLLAIALFALLHGYAHGLEMPQAAAPWGYGLGFLLATASLLGLGMLFGLRAHGFAARAGGALIAAAGLLLLGA